MMQHLAAGAPRGGWAANAVRSLLDWAGRVGADPTDSPETALQKRLMVALCAGTAAAHGRWSLIYLAAGAPLAAAIPGFYSLFTPLNTAALRLDPQPRLLPLHPAPAHPAPAVLLVMLALGGFRPVERGDHVGGALSAGLAAGRGLRKTVLWILGFVALLVLGALVEPYLAPAGLPDGLVTWFFVLNLGAVILVVFGLLYYFVGQRNFFQERSEMLLLNILPREISETLKAGPRTIAEQFDEASILFADVVDFTPMAAGMTPLGLVELLNEVFQCFDALVEQYDLEKIKTIGDCYMVAAGRAAAARRPCQRAGRSSRSTCRPRSPSAPFGGRRLAFRIGINSGPVVAGVIGRKKFIYDLWGEAVNLASRMESQGQAGAIQITERPAPGQGRLRLRATGHDRRQRRRPEWRSGT